MDHRRIIVLDWRSFVKTVSYSIINGQIACTFPTEQEEISHRVFKRLYCLMQDLPCGRLVIANDVRPYWRATYLENWYARQGIEPVAYKGNRENASWPFSMTPMEMEAVYARCREDAAKCFGGVIAQDEGLEADDVWGIIASETTCKVVGVTGDSDWSQCITEDGRVRVFNFTKNEWSVRADIRIKWIGGDSGDNVKGCTKLKKDGTPSTRGWGHDGAAKLLAEKPEDWDEGLSAEELAKNWAVVTLPCPFWNMEDAAEALYDCSREVEREECWDKYGVTAPVRQKLQAKAERDAWTTKLRLHFAAMNLEGGEA